MKLWLRITQGLAALLLSAAAISLLFFAGALLIGIAAAALLAAAGVYLAAPENARKSFRFLSSALMPGLPPCRQSSTAPGISSNPSSIPAPLLPKRSPRQIRPHQRLMLQPIPAFLPNDRQKKRTPAGDGSLAFISPPARTLPFDDDAFPPSF